MPHEIFSVLVIDDSENDRLLIRRAIQRTQQLRLVHCVKDGQEALTYLSRAEPFSDPDQFPFPDLLLLDIKMPVMNGFDLLRWMKHQCWGRKPAVALLTSSSLAEDINEGSELGADLYLIKPVTLDGLTSLMRDVEKFMCGRAALHAPARIAPAA